MSAAFLPVSCSAPCVCVFVLCTVQPHMCWKMEIFTPWATWLMVCWILTAFAVGEDLSASVWMLLQTSINLNFDVNETLKQQKQIRRSGLSTRRGCLTFSPPSWILQVLFKKQNPTFGRQTAPKIWTLKPALWPRSLTFEGTEVTLCSSCFLQDSVVKSADYWSIWWLFSQLSIKNVVKNCHYSSFTQHSMMKILTFKNLGTQILLRIGKKRQSHFKIVAINSLLID